MLLALYITKYKKIDRGSPRGMARRLVRSCASKGRGGIGRYCGRTSGARTSLRARVATALGCFTTRGPGGMSIRSYRVLSRGSGCDCMCVACGLVLRSSRRCPYIRACVINGRSGACCVVTPSRVASSVGARTTATCIRFVGASTCGACAGTCRAFVGGGPKCRSGVSRGTKIWCVRNGGVGEVLLVMFEGLFFIPCK